MPSDAFIRYQKCIADWGYEEYHEGMGYDVEALRQVTPAEAAQVVEEVAPATGIAWAEVEVLDVVGTPRALALLRAWTTGPGVLRRMCALSALHRRGLVDDAAAEPVVLQALSESTLSDGMTHVIAWTKLVPTLRIKRKVLWCALHGHADIRVHCAALAHFLYGVTSVDFDSKRRRFYLLFKEPGTAEAAYQRLCAEVGDVGRDEGEMR